MKTISYIFYVLIFLCFGWLQAQDSTDYNPIDTFTSTQIKGVKGETQTLSPQGSESPKPSSSKSASSTGDGVTPAQLNVSPSGAAVYTIPIAVPQGIDGVQPNLALTYNSQSGNGLAGWGWNLSGLSTISRIPATKYHDGTADPVDFDALDRFALDGKRLILKSGTYGKDNAVYQTENYSNLKITSHGISPYGSAYGPNYFKVQYPDGSVAYYGNSVGTRSQLEYAIAYTENPQGLRTSYSYTVRNRVLIPASIAYGGKGNGSKPHKVEFSYTEGREQTTYINGIKFTKDQFLEKISVTTNSTGYRSYELDYKNTTSLKSVLESVTEVSGDGTRNRVPISFDYEDGKKTVDYADHQTNFFGFDNISKRYCNVIPMDINADGEMDFVIYNRTAKNRYTLFKGGSFQQPIRKDGNFASIFTSTVLDSNNKIIDGNGMVVVQLNGVSPTDFIVHQNSIGVQGVVPMYTKRWNAPTYIDPDPPYNERRVPQRYLSGDFDGDGLTDVMAISRSIEASPIPNVTLINLDRRVSTGFSKEIGRLSYDLNRNDRLMTADMNGDGKMDVLHIRNGRIDVYSLNNARNLQFLFSVTHQDIKNDLQLILGDFNGDGKTDFLLPTKHGSQNFTFLYSKGNGVDTVSKRLGFSYREDYYNPNTGRYFGRNLLPTDFNGDGKTDIIIYESETKDGESTGRVILKPYLNVGESGFTRILNRAFTVNLQHYPIPIAFPSSRPNYGLEFASVSDRSAARFVLKNDHRKEVSLKTIHSNGVIHTIEYTPLTKQTPFPNNHYTAETSQVFPYVDVKVAPGISLVKRIIRSVPDDATTPEIQRLFRYKGAVSHLDGRGFLGFHHFAESNWHLKNDNPFNTQGVLYTNHTYDLDLKGATTLTMVTEGAYNFSNPSSGYISKTTNIYDHTLSSNKVFKGKLTSSTVQDALTATATTTSFIYDSYNNPTRETINYSGQGSTVTQTIYANNTGTTYYIGRPTKVTKTSTIGSNSFYSETSYTYSGALVTRKRGKGNGGQGGNDEYLETYTHDTYGNVLSTTLTPEGETGRTTSLEYDNTHRFVSKATDVEGLETTYTYDSRGNLSTETNPFGHSNTYTYDAWDRVSAVTDYLGNETATQYLHGNDAFLTIKATGADGAESETKFDPLGRQIYQRAKILGGKWSQVSQQYDVLDRPYKQSEPHFGNSASQWNTTSYDLYGRVTQQELYTGKNITYSYQGLTTSVDDGTQTVTTTTNALGNVTRVDDQGGTINYTYFGNGNLKSSSYNGATQTIEQDAWGRKTKLTDPSAGVYEYTYNGFGELTREKINGSNTTKYTYDTAGKLIQKNYSWSETGMNVRYTYDNTTKLLSAVNANEVIEGYSYSYRYEYDSYQRPSKITESNQWAQYEKALIYDSYGRIQTENQKAIAGGHTSTNQINYQYDTNGVFSGIDHWKLQQQNARGQLTEIELGTGQVEKRDYDTYGYLSKVWIGKKEKSTPAAIQNQYTFEPQRGTLSQRIHHTNMSGHQATYTENFEYDSLDRLTEISGAFPQTKVYDVSGRMTQDTKIGNYAYKTGSKRYQLKDLTLNTNGEEFYRDRAKQLVSYNAIGKPFEINEQGKGNALFVYGADMQRIDGWYGDESSTLERARYHRMYSTIIPAEIMHNTEENTSKFVFFRGGDAYTAPTVKIEQITPDASDGGAIYHLNRDHLGSILNITKQLGKGGGNSSSQLMESRYFGAWGNVKSYWSSGNETELGFDSLISRGYTGHEHLSNVNMIHMNGRIYDPKLGRFLSPDNNIQNPFNTQNYNRYTYVYNNPLKYNDPTGQLVAGGGEFVVAAAPYIGVGIMAASVLAAKWDAWGIKDWFHGATGGIFQKKQDEKPKPYHIAHTQISADPIMNPSPHVSSAFVNTANFYIDNYSGIYSGAIDRIKGLSNIITNPSSLLETPSSIGEALENSITGFQWAKTLKVGTDYIMAGASGNAEQMGYIYGGEMTQAGVDLAMAYGGTAFSRAFSNVSSKIIGTAQATGTRGHAFLSRIMAWRYALDPRVARVTMNRGYRKLLQNLTPESLKWGPRPDVGVLYKNGKVRAIEIGSKTDNLHILRSKHYDLFDKFGMLDKLKVNVYWGARLLNKIWSK